MRLLVAAAELEATSLMPWMVVIGLTAVAALGINVLQFFRMANGTDGQRQVEPTDMAAIKTELKSQTATLGKLDREMGGLAVSANATTEALVEIRKNHRDDIDGIHSRVGGISRELASTTARVEGMEKRERHSHHG